MDWTNWITYANQVMTWFIGLFPQVLGAIMSNPALGVPIVLAFVAYGVRLAVQFVGGMGGNKNKEE